MRPLVVGIVNVTPDSFSDGGAHASPDEAIAFARRLAAEGADALDIGGESTRPGADVVAADVETARVLPVIAGLKAAGVTLPIWVDTRKASVAEAALAAGAVVVNDVSAGTYDPRLLPTVAARGAGVVLMHMLGEPKTMQVAPRYEDVFAEVAAVLMARTAAARACGVRGDRIWIDPGLGFGKSFAHNETLLRRLEDLVALGCPVLVGASRKGFLGAITGRALGERLAGSLACAARAHQAGARAVRVHDVGPTVDLLNTLDRITPRVEGPRA